MDNVELRVNVQTENSLFNLLQEGFRVRTEVNVSVRALLVEIFGLDGTYVEERLSTIFLNGQCVDDIDSAIVTDGSVLALSSAMPGLAGASLRRGGIYRSLRSGVTYRTGGHPGVRLPGFVQVRLFNSVIQALGPHFLKRGVMMERGKIATFLQRRSESFWTGCREITVNGEPLSVQAFLGTDQKPGTEEVFLKVLLVPDIAPVEHNKQAVEVI